MIKKLLMGNEAIALGLSLQTCKVVTAYPGTPSSEILPSVKKWSNLFNLDIYTHWAINEKVAFETAYTASMTGIRSAVMMKQVGLNVASDALMSSAYMGTKGGFVLISADDPGPHSSQTEQDSRMMAMIAKIPVLDPSSPVMANKMVQIAYKLSESFEIPVMIRPTTRVCHSSQDIFYTPFLSIDSNHLLSFQKDTTRWAATPKFRLIQHINLNKKLKEISLHDMTYPQLLNEGRKKGLVVLSSGVASSYALDIITSSKDYEDIALYQILQPYPLNQGFINEITNWYEKILILEETSPVVEMQIARSDITKGKLNDFVPSAGELMPETVENILRNFKSLEPKVFAIPEAPPSRRPSLCAGCPHRASFFAIKKVFPSAKSIYTSDIGCYTLGINLKAVDTFICMGGAISQASGFYHAYKTSNQDTPFLVATIGDSTFFHAGIPPLIDAVTSGAKFLLIILDNSTTAMTGNQPTPESFKDNKGKPLVTIEKIVKACGIKYCKTANPYDFKSFLSVLKNASKRAQTEIAVVISKYPCLMDKSQRIDRQPIKVQITNKCDGCGYCIREFECPAIRQIDKQTIIDYYLCNNCGLCSYVCPKNAIVSESIA